MTYTTEELINLLQGERNACMNGERLKLSAKTTGLSKSADEILSAKGIQQVASYHDFRTEIWKYQAQNLVSGIVWEEIEIKCQIFRFPTIHDQLISLPDDVELMQSHKERIIDFWRDITQGLQLCWQGTNRKGDERPDMVINRVVLQK